MTIFDWYTTGIWHHGIHITTFFLPCEFEFVHFDILTSIGFGASFMQYFCSDMRSTWASRIVHFENLSNFLGNDNTIYLPLLLLGASCKNISCLWASKKHKSCHYISIPECLVPGYLCFACDGPHE